MTKVNGLNKWIAEWYEKNTDDLNAMMEDIWANPELGLFTKHAAETACAFAKTHGFPDAMLTRAGEGVKPHENPNAVIAEFGSGKPIIGIVGELDALPGLGNKNVPYREAVEGPGQGCGHNLIAGACMGAACALKYAMEKEGIKGTLRMIEAPGEEVGRGKALLAQDGVFSDLDMALMWHPGGLEFSCEPQNGMCIMAGNFFFHGKSAHAAGGPWKGRSALDAVQLMNMGCEFLREHVSKDCLIHYQITNGGGAPNIVPDFASVKYFCRAAQTETVLDLYNRITECAYGAARMTGTTVDPQTIFLIPYFYQNVRLGKHMHDVAQQIPDLEYTEEEIEFAKKLHEAYTGNPAPESVQELIPEKQSTIYRGIDPDRLTSTDAADMSYFCPTAHIHGGGSLRCTPGHHWVTTVCSGTQLGYKAAVRAGKVIAEGALEAFLDENVVKECWECHKEFNIPDYFKDVYSIEIHDQYAAPEK